ncbi:MAG: rod shape-determining protein MreC [Candidatus Omnitrophota bacterium]
MLKQKKPLFIIPVVFLLIAIFIFPPHKSVHFKSGFLGLLKAPLTITYRIYLAIFETRQLVTGFSNNEKNLKVIEKLKFQINQLKEEKLENQRLRSILQLQEKSPHSYIVAQVIGKEPTNWLNSIIINKGYDQGIFINQPVMSYSGLIGKVFEVSPWVSKILLISDVNSRVVVMVQRTREEGLLEGIGSELCRLKYLPVDADVELGDIVISAGVGGVYPKGLVIGKIESIKVERGGIYKNCIVKPLSPLSGLEEILCIKSDSKQ